MKRLLFSVGIMWVTFAFGIGIHRVFWQQRINFDPPPRAEAIGLAPVELRKDVPAPVAPLPPVPDATPKPILILDYDQEKFTPWAVFYIMGRTPREFANFDSLQVGLSAHVDDSEEYIAVTTCGPGMVCEGASARFALVTERRLFFATSPSNISEIEYRFDGEFLRTDFHAVKGKKIAVLRGTLTKAKNGRKIAERTFTFRMEHLGC